MQAQVQVNEPGSARSAKRSRPFDGPSSLGARAHMPNAHGMHKRP